MADDATFIDTVFKWFNDVPGSDAEASRRRTLPWLTTSNARVVATRVGVGPGSADDLLARASEAVARSDHLPAWASPAEAEEYLRALLDKIASDTGVDDGRPVADAR